MFLTDRVRKTARRPLRAALAAWRGHGVLDAAALARAWAATEPDARLWREWLDRILLALGVALTGAGCIVFFAYNWEALHRFARFGVLAAVISALAGLALLRPLARSSGGPDPARLAALAGGQIATGALLAVIGQTYQTGADAWQLFALWAALAIPWALAARTAASWWVVIVLGNVALLRWFDVAVGVEGVFTLAFADARARIVLALLLGAALLQLALWLVLRGRAPSWGFAGMGGARLLATLCCAYAAWLGVAAMSGAFGAVAVATLVAALTALGILAWWFRGSRFDVLVLSLASLAAIVLANAVIGRLVFSGNRDLGGLLLMGMLTIVLAATAARCLLQAWRNQRPEAA